MQAGDRDEMVGHTLRNEVGDFARRIGVGSSMDALQTTEGLRACREQFIAAARERNRNGQMAGRIWTVPFLVRHAAFHVLDHAWEMEDKDLSLR